MASIAAMIVAVSIFVWIVTGPRSLTFLTPYVEKQFSTISPNLKIKINDSLIRWDKESRSLSLDVTEVDLMNDTDEILASFPKISFDFSLIRLLKGQIISSDLTLVQPNFYVNLSNKALYVAKNSNIEISGLIGGMLANGLGPNSTSFPINSIKITDATFYIDNGSSEFAWHVQEGYERLRSDGKENKIISEFTINMVKETINIAVEVTSGDEKSVEAKVSFKNLPSYIAYDLFPNIDNLKNVDIRCDGDIGFLISNEGKVEQLNLDIKNADGEVYIPVFFKKKIKVKGTTLRASLYDDFSTLTIDNLDTDLFGPLIHISGNVQNLKNIDEINVDADVSLENLLVDDLNKYWPIDLGIKSREWVLENITGGKITKADARFSFTNEDIKKMQEWENQSDDFKKENPPPLPEKDITASILLEGANVHYLPDYPDITNVSGKVDFTSNTMNVLASSGKVFNSDVKDVSVKFNNMWEHPLVLDINGGFSGKVEDLINFLKAARKNSEPTEMFDSIYQATGDATGEVSLSIPLKHDLKYSEMPLKINAKFSNATLPKFFHGKDLTASSFDMDLTNDSIAVIGQTNLNGNDLAVSFERDFTGQQKWENAYQIKGLIGGEDLQQLNIINSPFITNKIGLDITITEKNKIEYFNGNLDITQSVISIPAIGFEKASGKKGSVDFSAIKKGDGTLEINNILVAGDKFSAEGQMNLTNNFAEVSAFDFKYLKFGTTDLTAKYSNTDKNITLVANGKGLDLSTAKFSQFLKTSNNSKKSIDIKADFNSVAMKNGQIMKDFTANANCDEKACKSVNAYSRINGDNYIALSMKPLGDRSSLMVESDNAGVILSAFGISENVREGNLNITSTFSDSNGKRVATGIVKIHNFRAIRTPTLGKLFTLASLQGISDLLNNEGITFKNFDAPFTLHDGVITVTEAKTSGASVGITSDGTIDTVNGQIDLHGAIVPAYAINKVLGDIPIVGNIIIGNKNEGILATKYKITGAYEDAKISVNPLTILTPSFLRNVFDIMDDK